MTKLFAETYPDTDEGRATMALARVASEIDGNLGSTMDAETRISVLVEMYRIERDDLPADLQTLYDEFSSHLGIA